MKKLLLILICLFVSFEVKSEYKDLRTTRILCTFTWHNGDELLESELYGYHFVSKMKEDEFNFHKSKNTPDEGFLVYRHKHLVFRYYLSLSSPFDSFDKDLVNYEATSQNIKIIKDFVEEDYDGTLNWVPRSEVIDRRNLTLDAFPCKIVYYELNNYFEERLDKKIKYLKSKQIKIHKK